MARMLRSVGPIVSCRVQFEIVPDDDADLDPRPRVLKVLTAGNLEIIDDADTSITYAVEAGDLFIFSPARIGEDTTATVVGWL